MSKESITIAILGLEEASSHFANDLLALRVQVVGYDPAPKHALHPLVRLATSNKEAVQQADFIFSVNLSDVAENVTTEVFPVLRPGQMYAEMNTASPQTKQTVAAIIQPSGALVVDVAIMAPVSPKGIRTLFLISGLGAKQFA